VKTDALWFFDRQIRVFPIKERSKVPDCKSWDDYTCHRTRVEHFANYGVALGLLGVVDSDSPASEEWVQTHVDTLCPTPLRVRGARGWHRYFRLARSVEKFIRRDGLTIEFRNTGQYVVGPGSIHPSGAVYTADDWSGELRDVPIFPAEDFQFNDGSTGQRASATPGTVADADFEFPDEVCAGERHDMLFRQLRSFKALNVSQKDAYEFLLEYNQNNCKPPLPADQLSKAWFLRGWHNADRPIGRVIKPFTNVITNPIDQGLFS
jgi:hypothetical protein